MKSFDVAIVGAGIVGAACAAALSREGLNIVIVDAGTVASGTTAAGMGHIVVMDDSDAQFALTQYSQQLWHDLAGEIPVTCEFENCGTIWVAANDDEMSEVRRKHSLYAAHGIATHILDEKSLHEAEPNLAGGLPGGLLVTKDAVVYQLTVTHYLLKKATNNGAELRTGARVTAICDGTVRLQNGDTIAAGKVINAAGPNAAELTPQLGLRRRKGHLVITERYHGFVRHQLIELGYLKSAHSADNDSVAFNVQPRKSGQLLFGSSRQFGREDPGVDIAIVHQMTERGFEYMPKLRGMSAVRIWTGFRPATPDNLPYIGKIPGFKSVYAAAGHEGLGITTSLGTAELLAAEIMGRTPTIPAGPYLPARG